MNEHITADTLELIDTQLRESQTSIAYDTKEYVVEVMVNRFEKEFFFIPEYQREFVWDKAKQSKFIESVIMGLPIPFLFGVQNSDGRTEILDGAQRINTLYDFCNNKLTLTKLERLDLINNFTFDMLPTSQQRKFLDRSTRMVILPETVSKQSRLDMFERINTGSEALKNSEIRKGSFSGPFYDFIGELAKHEKFNKLCPVSAKNIKRGEREELILRFFAYSEDYLKFKHSVFQFLDDFLIKMNDVDFDRDEYSQKFTKMLDYVEINFPFGFKKTIKANSTPRVRFEAIAIGVTLAQEVKSNLENKGSDFLTSKEFIKHVTSHASNSGPKLKGRVEYVRDWLLQE
ncbi:DUF262 domain-containing protein [Photobacterium sp. GB-72]|uniref:DUF262 domain-containing protein n=1 Tax=Photobacterium sp. GB-72 TaxID=2022105 RepID=UPI000D16FF76|nr:DUF262 domain-containing protein [Photobacterium sp. GB-72]PSV29651.1 DUF262 domain-containing protein [Photobacterium sp. GB-72]